MKTPINIGHLFISYFYDDLRKGLDFKANSHLEDEFFYHIHINLHRELATKLLWRVKRDLNEKT